MKVGWFFEQPLVWREAGVGACWGPVGWVVSRSNSLRPQVSRGTSLQEHGARFFNKSTIFPLSYAVLARGESLDELPMNSSFLKEGSERTGEKLSTPIAAESVNGLIQC